MTSLLKRTAVLSFSRFANQSILLLSPLLLVRLLSVEEYGTYHEFLVYVGLVSPMVSFAVARSLPYLIPKYPSDEKTWISQTTLFVAALSCLMLVTISVTKNWIAPITGFEFLFELQLYVIFFVNLDFVELYWLGKKRTDIVFYYSTGRLVSRTMAVLGAAYFTQDVRLIIYSLIGIEAVRFMIILGYGLRRRWFTTQLSRKTLALQMSYFTPLGFGALIETFQASAGRIFIATMAGPQTLAHLVVGMFAVKIVNVLRGSIADVIFPDIVEIKTDTPRNSLPLWKRATIWYALLLFPFAILFFVYSNIIVTVLFTDAYTESIVIFSMYALQFFPLCFDFHLPLRVQNANRYFVVGTLVTLVVNIGLLYPMYKLFGLPGVVVAAIAARWSSTIYLGSRVLHIYGIRLAELVQWADVGKILLAAIGGIPFLILGEVMSENLVIRGILFGGAYFFVYAALLKLLRVADFDYLVARIANLGVIRRLWRARRQ